MKSSLQVIEDYYFRRGLRGDKLRKATANDEEYMRILKQRRSKLTNDFPVKARDRKKYVLSTDQDYEILGKIYQLEKKKLTAKDKELVKMIRTQLEHDWRRTIVKFLNQLLKKYNE